MSGIRFCTVCVYTSYSRRKGKEEEEEKAEKGERQRKRRSNDREKGGRKEENFKKCFLIIVCIYLLSWCTAENA